MSEAYMQLHELSWSMKIDDFKYNRVAIFLGAVPNRLAWRIVQEKDGKTKRDRALEWVPGLTDSEWDNIQKEMMDFANRGNFSTERRAKRIDWIRALDMLREFQRE